MQKELIQIEFNEFAKGKEEISAVDFAHLILRYSFLQTDDRSVYIERVQERSKSDTQVLSVDIYDHVKISPFRE